MNFKKIHIGNLIQRKVKEEKISNERICNFMKCTEEDIEKMYQGKSLDTEFLLKWSKLLEYDFFRIYSQHLILYAPPAAESKTDKKESTLPQFRKNVYTQEIIDFILERIANKEMSKNEVLEIYRIPKTTLYKWIKKHKK